MKNKKIILSIIGAIIFALLGYYSTLDNSLGGYTKIRLDDSNQVQPYASATPLPWNIVMTTSTSKIEDGFLGLTTAGDLVYSDGTGLQRLGIGTAGQILRVNSGATAPEYVKAFSTGQTTRLAGSTGTQTIAHNLGRIPNGIIITAYSLTDNVGAIYPVISQSYGTANNPTDETVSYEYSSTATNNWKDAGQQSGYIIYLATNLDIGASAQLAGLDATNITLNWIENRSSGINGTRYIQWSVF